MNERITRGEVERRKRQNGFDTEQASLAESHAEEVAAINTRHMGLERKDAAVALQLSLTESRGIEAKDRISTDLPVSSQSRRPTS